MLTNQQILSASFSDILFQDRNKAYGAYLLRKEYTNHMKWALGAMIGICIAVFAYYFSNPLSDNFKVNGEYIPGTVEFIQPPPPPVPLPPPPPPPPAGGDCGAVAAGSVA